MECVGDVVHIVELLYKSLQQRAYEVGAGAGGDGSVAPPAACGAGSPASTPRASSSGMQSIRP